MTKFKLILLTILFSMSVTTVNADDDDSTILGSLLGAVVGGTIGNQFGGGSGKYVTTAVGAVVGSMVGGEIQQHLNQEDEYHPDYAYPIQSYQYYPQQNFNRRVIYVAGDDYLIRQRMSDAAKRRNMIRNGEADPLELPHDVSEVQTSWDDPFN